jgi:nucleotide-binding universal stress UspA family protein
MDRILVVIEDTDQHRELLREAAAVSDGTGADLLLLGFMTSDEFRADERTLEAIGHIEHVDYGDEDVLAAVEAVVDDIAAEEIDVPYEAVGAMADAEDRADEILRTARNRDCDHVWLPGRKRSPAGKAVFGDTTLSVIRNFDGFVTTRVKGED